MECYALASQLPGYFKRLNINQLHTASPAVANNNGCSTPPPQQQHSEPGNVNTMPAVHSPLDAVTPRTTQSLPTELRKRRKRCQERLHPYATPSNVKARKSLRF